MASGRRAGSSTSRRAWRSACCEVGGSGPGVSSFGTRAQSPSAHRPSWPSTRSSESTRTAPRSSTGRPSWRRIGFGVTPAVHTSVCVAIRSPPESTTVPGPADASVVEVWISTPRPAELLRGVLAEARRDLGQDLRRRVDEHPAQSRPLELRVVTQRVADEIRELGERLDARIARSDEDERQVCLGALAVVLGRGRLEPAQHVVAELDRVGEVLEAETVLGEAGDRQRPRERAQREDGLLVVDDERLRTGLDRGDALLRVERREPSEEQLGVRAHHPQRHDDVAGLERARRGLGQHRRVEHEVLLADDRRAALAEQAGDVRTGEAAARGRAFRLCGVPRLYDRHVQVSVIGSGAEHEARAEEVGRLLAERGCVVVTGGLGEVMAAALRGAKAAGGTTIGILPGTSRSDANEWIDHAVATGLGHTRNFAVAASGDAVIAVGGQLGNADRDRLRDAAWPTGRDPRAGPGGGRRRSRRHAR